MTTQEIAIKVAELNRSGDYETIYKELYANNAVSIENWNGVAERHDGIEAIHAKAAKWAESVIEIHTVLCSEPLVADSSFAITFSMDITYKEMGRLNATELAVYTVVDGKIVKEEFQA